LALWEKYKNYMKDDILHQDKQTNQYQNLDFIPEMYNKIRIFIEDLYILISNLSLTHYGMPSLDRSTIDLVNNNLENLNVP
jgi:hypothetical protein